MLRDDMTVHEDDKSLFHPQSPKPEKDNMYSSYDTKKYQIFHSAGNSREKVNVKRKIRYVLSIPLPKGVLKALNLSLIHI